MTFTEKDLIKCGWTEFVFQLKKFIDNDDVNLKVYAEHLSVYRISEDMEIMWHLKINKDMTLSACAKHQKVSMCDLLGFQHKLMRWSQLENIISRINVVPMDVHSEFSYHLAELKSLVEDSKIHFLLEQLTLINIPSEGRRFSIKTTLTALQQYIINRHAYRHLRQILCLPSHATLKRILGTSGSNAGSEECCQNMIATFMKKNQHCKYFNIIFDEVYVSPAARLRSSHVVGMSEDDPNQLARTVFALMLRVVGGKESFVVRLVPTFKLNAQNIITEIRKIIAKVCEMDGNIVALLCDNHPINRKVYEFFNSQVENSIEQPWIGREGQSEFFLLFDTVHLLKSFRNNWITCKDKTIRIKFNGETICAKWNDIVDLHNKEQNNVVKRTTLSKAAIDPSNLAKQNVALVLQVRMYK